MAYPERFPREPARRARLGVPSATTRERLTMAIVVLLLAAGSSGQAALPPTNQTDEETTRTEQQSQKDEESPGLDRSAAQAGSSPPQKELAAEKTAPAGETAGARGVPPPASAQDLTSQDPPRVSIARELNSRLPKWLRFDSEYRARVEEGLNGRLFQANDQDTYFLNRIRVGVTVRPADWLKFRVEGQDARAFGKNPPATSGFYDQFDVRLAYIEVGDTEKGTLALRAGRQGFYFGEGRLVAESLWSFPGARTFDALRATFRHNGYRLDAFAASAVLITRTASTGLSAPGLGNNIHGLYGGIEKLVPMATLEPYVFWRIGARVTGEDKMPGDLNFKTYGFRWVGKLPAGFDYGAEIAVQRGKIANSDFRAWAGHWVLGHTWCSPWKPRLIGEYNFATGDGNPGDNKVGTFDVLYPSAHLKWGETDQVGWRNIHDVRGGFEIAPRRTWTASTNYHSYWLADTHDGLYTASGSVAIPRVAAGTAGRWVGQELDIQGTHRFANGIEINIGVGHIFPGTFIKRAASNHGFTYPYAMMNYAF